MRDERDGRDGWYGLYGFVWAGWGGVDAVGRVGGMRRVNAMKWAEWGAVGLFGEHQRRTLHTFINWESFISFRNATSSGVGSGSLQAGVSCSEITCRISERARNETECVTRGHTP